MKIGNKPVKKILFGLLTAGEVFEASYKDTLFTFMRIDDSQNICYNAVNLINGTLTYFGSAEKVMPLYDAILLREQE